MELIERRKSRFFYCYSSKLRSFIKSFGIDYETKGENPNTKTTYYMFEKSEKLNAILEFWKECRGKFDDYPDAGISSGVVDEESKGNGGD